MPLNSFRGRTLAVAAVGALTLTGTALAAHPQASQKYAGPTSAAKYNGYRSQVTFTVSKDAKQLQNFTYQSTGCYRASGALRSGVNYLKKPANVHRLGTIGVSSNGTFSRKNSTTTYVSGTRRMTTTSSVSGHFKSSSTAVGTITFKQLLSTKAAQVKPCGPVKVTFTAKVVNPWGGLPGGY
jgi:hypothetical protein